MKQGTSGSDHTLFTLKYGVINFAKHALMKGFVSRCVRDFDCDWQHVNVFSHCVTLTHVLLLQIISYSDTEVTVLVVKKYKCASVIYVYELIF